MPVTWSPTRLLSSWDFQWEISENVENLSLIVTGEARRQDFGAWNAVFTWDQVIHTESRPCQKVLSSFKKNFYGEVMIDVMSSVHRVSFQAKCQAPILWCATNFIHLSALSKISFYSWMEKAINIQTKESHFKNPIHKKQPPRTFKQQSGGGKNVSTAQFSSICPRTNPIHCDNS